MAAGASFPILYFSPDTLTEAVLASGLLHRLHQEVPEAAYTVVATPQMAPLYRELPQLQTLITPAGRGAGASLRLWAELRRRRWGLILDPVGRGHSAWLPSRRRARPSGQHGEPAHKVIEAARLLQIEDSPPAPHLFLGEETRARARELVGEGAPVLAVAPAADWVGRTWPIERYARAAVQLLGEGGALQGGRLMMVGAPEDWKSAEALRRSIGRDRWIDLTNEPDPLVVHASLSRARLFIGGAVGLTHLAAAAGAPTLAVHGPDDEAILGVWGPKARNLRGPRSFAAIRAIDPKLDQPVCHMLDLRVEAVVEEAAALIDETEPKLEASAHG